MKINLLVSLAKAISAWLHSEGSSHFRTFTYPRIKALTRRFVNLGLYEQIDRFYRIVDDTFYNGVEEPDPLKSHQQLAAAERMAEVADRSGSPVKVHANDLPSLASIKDRIDIWKGLEQGRTYRCGTFTMNNMLRSAMRDRGLRPPQEVTAIDPLYLKTKNGSGKRGTVAMNAFRYLTRNGFPMPSWGPLMTDHDEELAELEKTTSRAWHAEQFAGIKTTGKVKETRSFEDAIALDRSLGNEWQMWISVSFSPSLKYFGQLVPFLKRVNGRFDLARTGGHAVHGVRGSFSTWEDGEEGVVIIDSAYRSYEDGWRFLKASLCDYGILTFRFVELAIEPSAPVTPLPTPRPPSTDVLAMRDLSFGDDDQAVLKLQEYLVSQGYAIPAGPTTYFGHQTRVALKNWQDAHFGPKYDGTFWGPISREKYRELTGA